MWMVIIEYRLVDRSSRYAYRKVIVEHFVVDSSVANTRKEAIDAVIAKFFSNPHDQRFVLCRAERSGDGVLRRLRKGSTGR